MHYLKFFVMLPLMLTTLLGLFLGGPWLWLGAVTIVVTMVAGDWLLGDDLTELQNPRTWLLNIPLYLALPCLITLVAALIWTAGPVGSDFLGIGELAERLWLRDIYTARAGNTGWHYLGAILGTGLVVGGWGINVAHELTHRTGSPLAMTAGRWLLSLSCSSDFAVEHVYGHHLNVGTDADPATARRGEHVYGFFLRSWIGSVRGAWALERKRLVTKELPVFSWHNQILRGYAMSLVWLILSGYSAGGLGLLLFLAQAFVARFLLEAVNYMEHYGLRRVPGESVKPHHSWNTNRQMSTMVLFTLTRHSAHHEQGDLPYWALKPYPNAPQMPYGYLTTIFLALMPPVWFRVIASRLQKWDQTYGPSLQEAP